MLAMYEKARDMIKPKDCNQYFSEMGYDLDEVMFRWEGWPRAVNYYESRIIEMQQYLEMCRDIIGQQMNTGKINSMSELARAYGGIKGALKESI